MRTAISGYFTPVTLQAGLDRAALWWPMAYEESTPAFLAISVTVS